MDSITTIVRVEDIELIVQTQTQSRKHTGIQKNQLVHKP